MTKKRVTSRLANKQKKELTKQSVVLLLLSMLIGVIFLVVILPGAIKLFFEVLDKRTVIEQESQLPPQAPIVASPPEHTNNSSLELSGYSEPNSLIKVLLNQREYDSVDVDDEGSFKINIELNQGDNYITLFTLGSNELESQRVTFNVVLDTEVPPIKIGNPEDGQKFETKENQTITIEGETEPKAKVYINNRLVLADSEGLFNYRYYLSDGDNKIEIKAVDEAGNEAETELTVHYRD